MDLLRKSRGSKAVSVSLRDTTVRYRDLMQTFIEMISRDAGHLPPSVQPHVRECVMDFYLAEQDWWGLNRTLFRNSDVGTILSAAEEIVLLYGETPFGGKYPFATYYRDVTPEGQKQARQLLSTNRGAFFAALAGAVPSMKKPQLATLGRLLKTGSFYGVSSRRVFPRMIATLADSRLRAGMNQILKKNDANVLGAMADVLGLLASASRPTRRAAAELVRDFAVKRKSRTAVLRKRIQAAVDGGALRATAEVSETLYRLQRLAANPRRRNVVTRRVRAEFTDACARRDTKRVKRILSSGFRQSELSEYPGASYLALRLGDAHWLRSIHQDDRKLLEYIPVNGASLLVEAATGSQMEAVAALVECGADVDGTDYFGRSALVAASLSGNVQIVKFLLEHGADASKREKTQKRNALMCACEKGHEAIVALLVEQMPPGELSRKDWLGETALTLAKSAQIRALLNRSRKPPKASKGAG